MTNDKHSLEQGRQAWEQRVRSSGRLRPRRFTTVSGQEIEALYYPAEDIRGLDYGRRHRMAGWVTPIRGGRS